MQRSFLMPFTTGMQFHRRSQKIPPIVSVATTLMMRIRLNALTTDPDRVMLGDGQIDLKSEIKF